MDNPLLTPEAALSHISAWRARLDNLATTTATMAERMADLRVTTSDRNRTVEVTLDSTGALADLKLNRRASTIPLDALARTILATAQDARTRLATRSGELIAETLGTESPTAQAITDQVRARLEQR